MLLPDGHVISPVEACLSDDPSPDQILIQKEDHHFRTQLQEKFLASLAADPPLQQFYLQLLAHEASPQPQPLKLSCRAVDNFRKRVRRRFRPLGGRRRSRVWIECTSTLYKWQRFKRASLADAFRVQSAWRVMLKTSDLHDFSQGKAIG